MKPSKALARRGHAEWLTKLCLVAGLGLVASADNSLYANEFEVPLKVRPLTNQQLQFRGPINAELPIIGIGDGPITVVRDLERIAFCSLTVTNTSRNGDRVVSAKDAKLGLPGGEKLIEVQVIAGYFQQEGFQTVPGLPATLTIRRDQGNTSGSAAFRQTGTASRELRTGPSKTRVTLLGRDISSAPRNLLVEAHVGGTRCIGHWSFTVFRIDPKAFIAGDANTVLPAAALTNAGTGPQTLRDFYPANIGGQTALGHQHVINHVAYGGIVIRGQVVPTGVPPKDFNRIHSRTQAFNWDRTTTGFEYNGSDCLNLTHGEFIAAAESATDDLADYDEDLLADPDDAAAPKDLFIWVIDAPNESQAGVPNLADIRRIRRSFVEHAQYAGVRASRDVPWYWLSSQENRAAALSFVQNDRYTPVGDNEVGLGQPATGHLTADLNPPPDFTVTASSPLYTDALGSSVAGRVDGTRLDTGGAACPPVAYLYRQDPTHRADEGKRTVIPLAISARTASRINGRYAIPTDPLIGNYDGKVFINGSGRTAPKQTLIDD
jgi:hypothetical protein